jgi:hypothetical protein
MSSAVSLEQISKPILQVWSLVLITLTVSSLALVSCAETSRNSPSPATAEATPRLLPSPTSSPTRTPTPTNTPTPTMFPTLAPLAFPTPPLGAEFLTLPPDLNRTGSFGSIEVAARWRDRNLLTGVLQGQIFVSVVQFDLESLAPNSSILSAALEITGRDASNLGRAGEWFAELIDSQVIKGDDTAFDDIIKAPALAVLGEPMLAQSIGTRVTKRFILTGAQRNLLEKQLDSGRITIRLRGPMTGSDNLFTWNAGPNDQEPALYLMVIQTPFVAITNTPTPQNVFAAATQVAQQTLQARTFGTPTHLPRSFVTTTPAPQTPQYVIVTSVPTPASATEARATAVWATAVAATTGTLTPIPSTWVTPTSMPLVIPRASLTRVPSPTPTRHAPTIVELAQKPLPPQLYNKIIFKEGPRTNPNIWVMDPDGTNVGLLTDHSIYDIAQARDRISPDGKREVYNAEWGDIIQIWSMNYEYPRALPDRLSDIKSGYAYAPAWSPDGNKIAYVVANRGIDDIYVWDWEARKSTRLTFGDGKNFWWAQFPSYSPDGNHIVFSTDMGHDATFSEIWIMNSDGTDALWRGNGEWDAYAPIWIKWHR